MEVMSKDGARQRIPELESICKVRPTSLLLGDLAACYFTLDDPERALPLAQQAWAKNRNPGIGMNLALILKDLGRHSESLHVVEEAFYLDPTDFYIKLGYAEGLLKAGFWKQAWPLYDNSRPTQQGASYDLRLPRHIKEWNGEPLPEGHRLLIVNEGGTGDRISYPRWLPELTKLGIDWVFYPYDALYSFFERIFPRDKLIKDGDDIVATHWTTAFALPAKLNISPSEVPAPLPITASSESIEKYKMTVPDGLPMVGICYSAAEKFQGDRKVRSLSEGQALRLVCQTGDKIHWVALQHGERIPYPVTNVPFETWEDLAGVIHNLDAVVSVDTSVMHFAGAMNKPLAVLLSGNACWKFLRKGKKLPLYPSANFYRNDTRGVEDAINSLIVDIRAGTWPSKN